MIDEMTVKPFSDFEIEGQRFTAHRGEDVPRTTAALISECERRNLSNPALERVNQNTWIIKKSNV